MLMTVNKTIPVKVEETQIANVKLTLSFCYENVKETPN
jgi:hypothetical protein